MSNVFMSLFAKHITEMIDLKVSLGYNPKSYSALVDFDKYCIKKYSEESILTKELVSAWAILKDTESANGLTRRLITIREFGKYLNYIGIEAYVIPTDMIGKCKPYFPCIFTENEIYAFFNATDSIPIDSQHLLKEYTIPTLFRIIYCCGLRPQESYNLKTSDVDLKKGLLFIRESKRHKDRIISVTSEVLYLCQKYDLLVNMLFPEREYFFQISVPHRYKIRWIDKAFIECWDIAGITDFRGKKPRVYDFRHNYATRIMVKWLDEGKDIMAMLPYLSSYMGHTSYSSTAYYIHLIPERLINNKGFDWYRFEKLIPEVSLRNEEGEKNNLSELF